ncbi:hypothetical protein ABAC460_21890 [Asticcacaulis sp. AC460]|uniref:RES family NAD+ phosphorylase n=1 Tax=Asticcacaulis sp. AC460 TaxID=1282360 RepID=UPI0003C3D9A7|nr:RES family NAD+ phosphorylase [Asticcacaulis sp. AC460]ESQ86872.1 hypothetical protein ABAC460_21890 [Asticcacaulis sp. AC460]
MTVSVWRIATDTPDYTADDLSGAGAKTTGGRWNRQGTPLLYAAQSVALACLETFVHLRGNNLPFNRYLVRFDIPDAVWVRAERLDRDTAPVGWDALPTGKVSLDFGDGWALSRRSAILVVPSIVVPEESNILINPHHSDAASVTAVKLRRWQYDSRMPLGAPG